MEGGALAPPFLFKSFSCFPTIWDHQAIAVNHSLDHLFIMVNLLNAKALKEQASLVDLLNRLGYTPVKKSGKEQMYRSMLRDDDRKPSFAVDDELGVWFDHGTRKGGNIIDFGLLYWKGLSFNEVIEKIQQVTLIVQGEKKLRPRLNGKAASYTIEEVKPIGTHPAITTYLKSRGIFEIGKDLLSEVYYYIEDDANERKHFFAAAWKNENGSWEVRNKYFKGCLGHKAITFIPGHEKNLAVFEGFMNYLSWKVENPSVNQSIIILNTLALLPEGIDKAIQFSAIDIYFDRDRPGHTATNELIKALPYATDRSRIYSGYNDYNDRLISRLKSKPEAEPPEIKQKSSFSY